MVTKTIAGMTADQVYNAVPVQNSNASAALLDAIKSANSQNNTAVYKYDTAGEVIEKGKAPKSTSFTVTNSNVADAAQITAVIFNEDFFLKTPTTNGTGAGNSVVKSYNDGFGGVLIERLLAVANGGRGLKAKGFNISFKDADGNQDFAALENCEFTIQSYTGIGGKTDPYVLDLTEAIRNNQFQQGLLTIDIPFWVNVLTQITILVPKGYTANVNVRWDN